MPSIFSKIIAGEIPSKKVYSDDLVTAFWDINPQRAVHILIVPNKEIRTVSEVTVEDELMLGRMFTAARRIAEDLGIAQSGYRLIVNCGEHGGQEVPHVHMHLLGGESVGPMLKRKSAE
ncbi:MAG: histidine triad nucleotide-binding protein [Chloroflexi bacterium]|nr:histidine triad nucleotide-binding protein [Chloroflexota bacterium]MBV6435479.1 Purine nucleoside phosphoramidase [Anaerolineae bacterium]MDL1914421.1 histidine triad nucleotide-binding protein [Anaerolineae bacterium CFX4]MBW7879488.1 histidine triad nucleotide-binding protein [Anaerolineae bacterium]MCC6564503.1 histidine triad nucleotide-binding protein [Chloroflexota bacterium]